MTQSTARAWAYRLTGLALAFYLLANCLPMYSFAVGLGDPVVEWFLSVTTQTRFSVRGYPLVVIIADLFWSGEYILALIILAFTVLFPLVKMIGVLLLLSDRAYDRFAESAAMKLMAGLPVGGWIYRRILPRAQLAYTLEKIGPWSMLDVFVLSVVTVMLKQAKGTVYELEAGIYLFAMSVMTQIAGSHFAKKALEITMSVDQPPPSPASTPQPATAPPELTLGRKWRWCVIVQGIILVAIVTWVAWERLSATRVVHYPGTVVVGSGSSPTRLYSNGDIDVGGRLQFPADKLDFAELVAKWNAAPLTQTAEFDIELNTGGGAVGAIRLGPAVQRYIHPVTFGRKIYRVLVTPTGGFAALSQVKSLTGSVDPDNPRRAMVEVRGDSVGNEPRIVPLRIVVFFE